MLQRYVAVCCGVLQCGFLESPPRDAQVHGGVLQCCVAVLQCVTRRYAT